MVKKRQGFMIAIGAAIIAAAAPAGARETLRDRIAERRSVRAAEPRAIRGPGDYEFRSNHDGVVRSYLVHAPQSFRPGAPQTIVLGLHGGGGHAEHFARDENYGVISASEKYGFVAVIPNGFSTRRNGRFAAWNAGACCGRARDENIDDVGFLKDVVSRVKTQIGDRRARVFAMGMSNGGLMSYRLACEAADVIDGIMAVAGTDNTNACAPSRPVPVLHVHALDDTHVLYEGGAGEDAFRDSSAVTEFASVPATVEKWVGLNGATEKPRRVFENDGAWCDLYDARTGGAPVKLCVTRTGGHSWPGAARTQRGKPPASQAINANDEMWRFLTGGK